MSETVRGESNKMTVVFVSTLYFILILINYHQPFVTLFRFVETGSSLMTKGTRNPSNYFIGLTNHPSLIYIRKQIFQQNYYKKNFSFININIMAILPKL